MAMIMIRYNDRNGVIVGNNDDNDLENDENGNGDYDEGEYYNQEKL